MSEVAKLLEKLTKLYQEIDDIVDTLSEIADVPASMLNGGAGAAMESRLRDEVSRSERYKHAFTLGLVELTATEVPKVLDRVQRRVRAADVVGVLGQGSGDRTTDQGGTGVLVLMPETDQAGGNTALRRALDDIDTEGRGSALVSYPDDATDAGQLFGKLLMERDKWGSGPGGVSEN